MKPSIRILPTLAALGASLGLLAACGGGGDTTGMGTLRLALTDAPSCGYDEINVSIEKIRVHKSASAADADAGWVDLVFAQPKKVNLLNLTNGVLEELGSTRLEAGHYTQMRLVLAGGANANTVRPSGMGEMPMTTPSGMQSGLKLNIGIDVAADEVADAVLDFDACKSVVKAGQSGRHLLKPVIAVLPRLAASVQSVAGTVVPALANGQTRISLQQNGAVVRSTVPWADGRFLLSPLPAAGSYDLVISAAGRVTAVMTGVAVTGTALTTVNPAVQPIDLPASPTAKASGSAVTSSVPATVPDATVRALQAVGAATVEVAARRVDADDGGYSFVLPTAAPVSTAYAAGATAIAFTAQPASAGKYRLEASVPGKASQFADVDLATGDKLVPQFVFAP